MSSGEEGPPPDTQGTIVSCSDPFNLTALLLDGGFNPLPWLELCLESLDLVTQSRSTTLLSRPLIEGRIEMMAHQISAALRARDRMDGRALLADEVGLGKTIEACIIYEEYALMGLARRILILTPPALVSQWHEELRAKFSEDFVIASRLNREFKGFDRHDRIIASMDAAKRPTMRERICSIDWDMLIVDEAHRLKNARTQNYRLVRAISSKYLLMLTATPIQNNLTELYNLVNLVRPGLLGSRFEFQSRFSADAKGRKVTNRSTLQNILSEVMVRTTRKETGLAFTRRFSNTIRLSPTSGESRLYNAVTDYVRSRYDSLSEGKRARSAPDIFLLITLQRQLASSTPAIARALALRLAKAGPADGRELEGLLRLAEGIGEDIKLTTIRELARTTSDKMLIFTTFLRTQEYIKDGLEQLGMEVVCYNGAMDEAERGRSLKAFMEGAQVLISTEAGSEGMNLQFCHIVVNYDLPWNPLRVEQRIGRIHRIGQGEDVRIINLTVKDTIEDHILELLYEKIQLFQLTIGDLELILGDEVGKIEPRIFRTFMENDKRGAKRAIEELGSIIQKRKERVESVKKRNEAFFEPMHLSPLRGDPG